MYVHKGDMFDHPCQLLEIIRGTVVGTGRIRIARQAVGVAAAVWRPLQAAVVQLRLRGDGVAEGRRVHCANFVEYHMLVAIHFEQLSGYYGAVSCWMC